MLGIGLGLGLLRGDQTSYHPDISGWATQVAINGGTLTATEKAAFSKARALVADATWARIYQLCAFPVANSIAKRTPIVRVKGPSILTVVGSPTEVANGYSYDGTTGKYVRTGITPSTDGISVLNSTWMAYQDGVGVGLNAVNRPFGGAWSNSGTLRMGARWRTTAVVEATNGPTSEISYATSLGANTTYGPFAGAFGVSNRAANDSSFYRNGTQIATDTTFSTDTPPTIELYSGPINGGGAEYPVGTHSFWLLGQGLTAAQILEVQSFMDCAMQNLGFMRNIMGAGDSEMADGSGPNIGDGAINSAFVSTGYSSWYQASTVVTAEGGTGLADINAKLTETITTNPQYKYWNWLFSVSRNDLGVLTVSQLVDGSQAIMNRIGHQSYRWVEVINKVDGTENAGSPLSIKRIAVNTGMRAAIGQHVVEWQPHLMSKADLSSLADVQALDNDLIPISMSDGGVHTSTAAKPYYRESLWNSIKAGWLNFSRPATCYGQPLAYRVGKTGTNPVLGDVVRAIPGGWDGNPTYTFQWKRNGVNIPGATSEFYTVTGADAGATLTCAVTGSNSFGSATATTTSLTVGVIQALSIAPVAAHSIRKLSSTYSGSAIRVRRSSDNNEQDIGFTAGGDLDTTALLTFCGAGDGFITTWYDQSGNSRNAVQAAAGVQPRIVAAGSVDTLNGRPAFTFLSSTPMSMDVDFGGTIAFNSIHAHGVFRSEQLVTRVLFQLFSGAIQFFDDLNIAGFGWRMRNNAGVDSGAPSLPTNTNQHVGYWGWDGASVYLSHDNAAPTTASAPSGPSSQNGIRIAHHNAGPTVWTHVGNMQEFMLFDAAASTNDRNTLARSAGTYYGVTVA